MLSGTDGTGRVGGACVLEVAKLDAGGALSAGIKPDVGSDSQVSPTEEYHQGIGGVVAAYHA